MAPANRVRKRAVKRTLVRWNDDLDELLLLTIQSVCNANGIRIPWADVAEKLGHNATEGAIVQHLAKIRIRRVQSGKAVPPPLRRAPGGSSAPSAKIQVKRGGSRGRGGHNATAASSKAAGKATSRKRARANSNINPQSGPRRGGDESSSGDEWSRRSKKKWNIHKRKGLSRKVAPIKYESSADERDDEGGDDGQVSKVELNHATFLEYPNDRELTDSPSDGGQRKTGSASEGKPQGLLLKLKYRGKPLDIKPNIVASPPASDGAAPAPQPPVTGSGESQWNGPPDQQVTGDPEHHNQWPVVTGCGTHELAPELLGEIESVIGSSLMSNMQHDMAGDIISDHNPGHNGWSDFDGVNFLHQSDQDAEAIARMYSIQSPFFEFTHDDESEFQHNGGDLGLTLEYPYPENI